MYALIGTRKNARGEAVMEVCGFAHGKPDVVKVIEILERKNPFAQFEAREFEPVDIYRKGAWYKTYMRTVVPDPVLLEANGFMPVGGPDPQHAGLFVADESKAPTLNSAPSISRPRMGR